MIDDVGVRTQACADQTRSCSPVRKSNRFVFTDRESSDFGKEPVSQKNTLPCHKRGDMSVVVTLQRNHNKGSKEMGFL